MSSPAASPTRRRPAPLYLLAGLTIRGRCLLIAGITATACAVILDERDLLRVAVFVIALPLFVAVTTTLLTARVRVRRELSTHHLPVGQHCEVQLDIDSSGNRPIRNVLLDEKLPYSLGGHRRFVADLSAQHRSRTARYSFRPTQRGDHRIGPLYMISSDPFGLFESSRQLVPTTRLVVVPRITTLRGVPYRTGSTTGENTQTLPHAEPGHPDVIVRPYRRGDDLRKVHWRSTARRDEIMVRLDEQPSDVDQITVLLDRRIGLEGSSGWEWAVEFAASTCTHLHRKQYRLRLVDERGTLLATTQGTGSPVQENEVLEALATVRSPSERKSLVVPAPGPEQEVLTILSTQDTGSARQLLGSRSRRHRSMAVLVDSTPGTQPVSATDPTSGNAEGTDTLFRMSGWDCVLARPTDPVWQIWSDLCRVTTTGSSLSDRHSS